MHPNDIARNLMELSRQLDELVKEYRELGDLAAERKRDAELAYARAYMSSEGTVDERKQAAIEQALNERYLADLAERQVSGCREAVRALHARIEVGRTLSATTRDEIKLSGVGT